MVTAPAKDLTSIGTFAGNHNVSVRRIESAIEALRLSGLWRLNGTVYLDGRHVEKLIAHLGERVTLSRSTRR